MTKPSRRLSHGPRRLVGVSLKSVDSALQALKPAMPMRQIAASAPPATMTSASSSWIRRAASPSACGAGGAGRDDGMVRAPEAVLDRDLAEARLISADGNEERADAARSALLQHQRGLVDRLQAADARADHHAGAVEALIVLRLPARILDRLLGGGDAEDQELVELALVLGRNVAVDVEMAVGLVALRHLARDLGRKIAGVEGLDRPDAGLGRHQAAPVGVDAVAQRRHHPHAR
jgi:hypothetical protein